MPFCASNNIFVKIAWLLPFFISSSKNFLKGMLWWLSICNWISSKIAPAFTNNFNASLSPSWRDKYSGESGFKRTFVVINSLFVL